jgi:hypothetical protein
MKGRRAGLALLASVTAFAPSVVGAQDHSAAQQPPDPLRVEIPEGYIKFGLMGGLQIVTESRSFWSLSRRLTPAAGFNPTMSWGEGYLKPSLTFERRLAAALSFYGGLSAIGSGTHGRDVFDSRDQGRFGLEEAYAGLRFGRPGAPFSLDLSAGAQAYRIGSGMLISDGAADGFERGALIFGPRQAWAMTAIARASFGPLTVDGFYLQPNELRSSDTKTRLAGGKAEWTLGANQFAGVAYGQVLNSTAPYPQAAPGGIGPPAILPNAREGLQFAQGYVRVNPLPAALPGLWVAGDLAVQWSDRVDMRASGGRAEIGYAFDGLPWRPTVSYAYQTFSGDNPRTRRLERFDPLFYDGSPPGWATGSNGSFVFINSNVNAHRLTFGLSITPRDLLTIRYAHVRANELGSPIQFGQATRLTLANGVPALVSGVRKAHLSDDFLVEYTRVVSQNVFLTVGAAYSNPGAGLKEIVAPQQLSGWGGGFANLVVRY